jgi:hypothetical protein
LFSVSTALPPRGGKSRLFPLVNRPAALSWALADFCGASRSASKTPVKIIQVYYTPPPVRALQWAKLTAISKYFFEKALFFLILGEILLYPNFAAGETLCSPAQNARKKQGRRKRFVCSSPVSVDFICCVSYGFVSPPQRPAAASASSSS